MRRSVHLFFSIPLGIFKKEDTVKHKNWRDPFGRFCRGNHMMCARNGRKRWESRSPEDRAQLLETFAEGRGKLDAIRALAKVLKSLDVTVGRKEYPLLKAIHEAGITPDDIREMAPALARKRHRGETVERILEDMLDGRIQ